MAPGRAARGWGVSGLVTAVCLAAAAWGAPVHAQQPVSLATLEIALWPEFDQPSMLVILNGQLATGVTLPASLTVHLPAAAGRPNAVAVVDANGGLFETPYTTTQAGGDIIIAFTTSTAGFRVEYYDPSLVINGEARSFGLRWKTDLPIQAVTVRVQQPVEARGLTGRPALTAAGVGDYGLSYYTAALGPAAAGSSVSFDLGYSKTGSALSATAVANTAGAASAPAGTPAAATASGQSSTLPVLLLMVALVGAGVAGYFWFWPARGGQWARRRPPPAARRGQPAPTRAAQARSRRSSARSVGSKPGAAATVGDQPAAFCPQCGRRYQAGDRFCRQCGAPVRE